MGTDDSAAHKYLYRKVVIDKEIVTYRVLSRELSIHVNEAKKELEAFYKEAQTTPTPVHATYLVSGVVSPTPTIASNDFPGVEDASQQASTSQTSAQDLVPTTQFLLAREDHLESCKSQFQDVSYVHMYSLSLAMLKDPALLATTSELVGQKDNASPGPEYAKTIGMILNPHWSEVQDIKGKGKAKAMAPPPPAPAKPPVVPPKAPLKRESSKDLKSADGPSGVPKVAEKLKAGILDWGKAKVKGAEASSSKLSRTTGDGKLAENGVSNPKRGIKREVPESDTEEDVKSDKPAPRVDLSSKSSTSTKSKPLPRSASATSVKSSKPPSKDPVDPVQISKRPTSPAPSVRVKRRILLSDEEEEEEQVVQSSKPAKRAKPAIESNSTKKLGTKVLIDDLSEEDGEVDTKPPKTVHRTSGKRARDILDSDEEDGNVSVSPQEPLSDASEDAPEHVPLSKNEARRKLKDPRVKAAPKVKQEDLGIDAAAKREKEAAKKALKKEVKKGKLKTRTYTNARGMLVTEDYFSPDTASDVDGDKPTDPPTKDVAEPKKEASKPQPKPRPRTSRKAKEDVQLKAADEDDAAAPDTTTKKLPGEELSTSTSTRVASDHKNDQVDSTPSTKKPAATNSDKDRVVGSKTAKTTNNSKGDAPAAIATATGKKLPAASSEKGKPAASATTKATKAKTAGQRTLAGFFKQ